MKFFVERNVGGRFGWECVENFLDIVVWLDFGFGGSFGSCRFCFLRDVCLEMSMLWEWGLCFWCCDLLMLVVGWGEMGVLVVFIGFLWVILVFFCRDIL